MATPTEAIQSATKASVIKRVIRWVPWALGLLLVVLLVRHRLFATVPVRSHKITSGDVVVEVFGRGTIESRREVQLGFDLTGRISDLLVLRQSNS